MQWKEIAFDVIKTISGHYSDTNFKQNVKIELMNVVAASH